MIVWAQKAESSQESRKAEKKISTFLSDPSERLHLRGAAVLLVVAPPAGGQIRYSLTLIATAFTVLRLKS
jgi:hypothetical protein